MMAVRNGRKIGFMGAGGTGKTTSARFISDSFHLPLLKSASREVYEELDLTEAKCLKLDAFAKWELQKQIFNKKIQKDDENYSFVADRTLLDHWAYCLMYCATTMSNEEFAYMETLVRKHMQSTYTNLFYFPFGFWFPDNADGVRQDSRAWQNAIDSIIVGYIVRWNLPVIQVPQNSADERNSFIEKTLQGNQAGK